MLTLIKVTCWILCISRGLEVEKNFVFGWSISATFGENSTQQRDDITLLLFPSDLW